MAGFTAKDVQALRQASGAGMMDAKRALEECGGDAERAATWLREQGLAAQDRRAGRENTQGAIAVAADGQVAALVELKCETDFVAKSDDFTGLAEELAALVVAKGEGAAAEREPDLVRLQTTLKENIALGRVVRFEAGPDAVLDTYLHVQNDRGVIGVIVELTGGDRSLAHEVALHIASQAPRYLERDDVPSEEVAAEREVLENLTRNEGKPEPAIPKIVEGRLGGFYRDVCLMEQNFVKDPRQTVRALHGPARVTRFARVQIGQ
ncbi:MAG: translation elongation factor Ts [Acidimicrobiales bacterium]